MKVSNQSFTRKLQNFLKRKPFLINSLIFSYKDCPSFDLDKLLEDVQNGLYPITAYHLLFPTHSSLNVPNRSTMTDKNLTSSTSSIASSSTSAANENDVTTPIQTVTDPSLFHAANTADMNPMKSRANTSSSAATHNERSGSVVHDSEHHHHRRDSTTTPTPTPTNTNSTNNNNNNNNNNDEKENRRIVDIQCKLKTKETGLCMVNE